jgi:hypothetical protein
MDREKIREVKLAYFGQGSPRLLGLRHQQLGGMNSYTELEHEWPKAEGFASGDIVAIGGTPLAGSIFSDTQRYRSVVGHLTPIARVGNSIYVYWMP